MEKSNIKITSKSIEGFKEIEETLNALPENIRNQIVSAEKTFAIDCILKNDHTDPQQIYLPRDLLNISVGKNEKTTVMTVVSPNFNFHFKAPCLKQIDIKLI